MTETGAAQTCIRSGCTEAATHVLVTETYSFRRSAMLASEAPPESQGTVVAGQTVYGAPVPYYCAEHATERAGREVHRG